MDVIELDHVVARQRGAVAPRPANRDAGVVEVVDQVVRDAVVRRLADPDAHGAGEELAAVVNVGNR